VVGEVGTETGSPLQGFRKEQASRRHRCRRSTLVELTRLPERSRSAVSRYSVHGSPPRRFDGHAVFRRSPSAAEAAEAPIGLGPPPGHTCKSPPESCAAPATLMRFAAPTATSARRSTSPGIPNPVRSASRVSRPLDGFLPHALSGLEDRCRSWGSPFRVFPPRRAVRLSAPGPSCRF
jgi:hypothetical protein